MRSSTRHVSFFTIAEACAPWSRWIVDVAIAVKCIGVGISYIQVSGDTISHVIGVWSNHAPDDTLRRAMVVLAVLVLAAPVCFARSISKTVVVNVLGLLAITYVVVLAVALTDYNSGAVTRWDLPPTASFSSVLSVVPTFIFAFTCHQNILLCAEDMKERSQRKLDVVAFASEAAALVLFIPAIIFPYLDFGENTRSNVVLDYDVEHNIAVQVGYLFLGIAEAAAYPLQLFPARKSLLVLFTRAQPISPKAEFRFRIILTSFILLLTAGIAVSVRSLGVTLSFVGIIGSNTICFIMPTFFYCITMHKADVKKGPKWALPARKSLIVLALRGRGLSPKAELYSRLGVGTAILLLTIAVALSVHSLGVTLSFVGAVGSNTITFIMPCFLYCMTIHKAGLPKGVKWVLAAGLCVIGLIILPLCLSSLIYEVVNK
ncbi:hypothetical protein FOZ60_009133 [Perkinsus olseni]|uniref:Amino acid transporter transmembrane domain-containing protein n=1 Tax=Perkinsus olseni TaxID=32597 RepID=A0A7J6NJZ1_PEROL|nr:hypothetical protein FOZ60_009133 [Perkinsus olseni]